MMNNYDLLDILTILSFVLQLQNNDELHKQSTNDEIIEKLHNDILEILNDNRLLFKIVIEQNEQILSMLRGDDSE